MLDFRKLIAQIEEVGKESLVDRRPGEQVLSEAVSACYDAASSPAEIAERLERNQAWVLWPLALPLEPFGSTFEIDNSPSEAVTVAATDGSQIMPSHHEIYSCYLLNIGIAVISYGVKLPPVLTTEPRLYHKPEDLYPLVDRRRLHIDELYVSLERNLLELETLSRTCLEASERSLPVVALLDGSLIPWSVEKMPESYQYDYLQRMEAAIELLRTSSIPLVGYLSHSRSSDVVNALRVWKCPYQVSHCHELCGHLNEEQFPCSCIWPLADRQLFQAILPKGQRTGIFLSGASVARSLAAEHRTCFSYFNVGYEVARLEFPRWLAEDRRLLERAFRSVGAQVEKGRGYPVALAEAHNLAVIRSTDRARFFDLLSRHLVSLGVDRVSVSPKEARKRRGIV